MVSCRSFYFYCRFQQVREPVDLAAQYFYWITYIFIELNRGTTHRDFYCTSLGFRKFLTLKCYRNWVLPRGILWSILLGFTPRVSVIDHLRPILTHIGCFLNLKELLNYLCNFLVLLILSHACLVYIFQSTSGLSHGIGPPYQACFIYLFQVCGHFRIGLCLVEIISVHKLKSLSLSDHGSAEVISYIFSTGPIA